jgi:hypothetical protein
MLGCVLRHTLKNFVPRKTRNELKASKLEAERIPKEIAVKDFSYQL